MNLIKKVVKKSIAIFLALILLSTSFVPALQTPLSPQQAQAAGDSCGSGSESPTGANLQARVGGVALDQAATFLASMDDITGAYYDSNLDRIVFVGKKNTTLPEFDRDDLAVAIKAVIFNKTIPMLSIETDPNNPDGPKKVLYYGGIEDTRFGKVLFDADYAMKKYEIGYNENQQKITSSVPGYKSVFDRWVEIGPTPNMSSSTRFWLTPQIVSLKKDDAANAFVFDQVKMQIKTEPLSPNNDPAWNQAADEFVQHHTQYYDTFAQETSSYTDAKQLGKIVSVIKWLNDNNIPSDFNWALDYAPKIVASPRQVQKIQSPLVTYNGLQYQLSGAAEYKTPNTYNADSSGTSVALKNASEAVSAPKEDIHWTFTKDGQQYESVAVAADAFRSLGSYNTTVKDMSFPSAGDINLAFQRTYSSYSGGQYGMGRGWGIIPARLFDNNPHNPAITATCPINGVTHLWKFALDTPEGGHETFTFTSCQQGFVADDPVYHTKLIAKNDNTEFTATMKNQTQYIFDQNFRLTKVKDKNGNTINYNYDGTGKLISIADSKNHIITINYNSQNLISAIADWSGRTVSYAYDGQGNLLTVTDPKLGVTTYAYDTNFKLISITDREGKTVLTNTYTQEAKLATQKDAANIINTYSHDDVNRAVTVVDNQVPSRTLKTVYDAKARVLEQIDPALKSIKYTYGTEFTPLTITDKNNNKITNTYDSSGNLTSVTYPDLKKVTFEYDSKNRLTKITDERYGITAKETTFTYDASGNLTQSSEAGLATNFTYDLSGEMLTLIDPLIHKTTWTRDSFGNKLTEVDAFNKTTTFEYDAIARLKKITDADTKTTSYAYDNNGNLLTQTNAVGTTTNIYNKENRLVKTTLPNNTVTEYAYNTSDSLTSVKDPLLNLTFYNYDAYQNLSSQQDALNRTTTHVYDQMNRQTQSTTPLGKVSKWEYDPNGNITKRIDANNNSTTYTYDAFNRLTKITYPDTKTATYTYDNRGNILSMVDPIGTTTYTYDNFDRLLTVKNPYGRQIAYTYDASDNLTKITYPDNLAVTYTYDVNNRLASVKDWNNNTASYAYYSNGLLSTRTMPNGVTSTYSYDGTNRLSTLEHTKSGSTLAKFAYERDSVGNITKVTEEGSFFGVSTPTPTPTATPTPTPTTSGQDLVITSISTTPLSPNAGSSYSLSIKVKNQGTAPTGNVFVRIPYYYDLASMPTNATPINYSYSTNINLAALQETTLTIASAAPISTSGAHTIWALVDRDNAVPETNENNNASGPYNITVGPQATPTPTPTNTPTPTPTSGPTATPTPTPSLSGPDLVIINITTTPANPTKNQLFTISTIVKNQGTVGISNKSIKIGYYYDLTQSPTYITSTNASGTFLMTLASGASQTFNYSAGLLTTSGAHTIRALVDQGQVQAETNENNNAGGPTSVTVATSGVFDNFLATIFTIPSAYAQQVFPQFVTSFTYDPLSRLLSAGYPDNSSFTYTYDKVDNRLVQNVATPSGGLTLSYSYNNDNQLTGVGSTAFTYDNNGNQLQKVGSTGTTGFIYNFDDRLTKYTPPTGSATTYIYDGNNNRLAKVVGSTTTRFVTDISGDLSRVLAETNSFNSITKSYIYGLGLISQGTTGSTSRQYFLEDGQGNVRFLTNNTGGKITSLEYDPYGNFRSALGTGTNYLYQTQQKDAESSLYYLRARYYDPLLGRFISKDPVKGTLTSPQSQNGYSYAHNNPVNLSDPSGEQILPWIEQNMPTFTRWGQACVSFIGKVATKATEFISKSPSVQSVVSDPNRINHILQEEHAWGKVVSDPNDWNQVSQVINKVVSSGGSSQGATSNNITKTLQIGKEWVEVQLFTNPSTGVTSVVDAWVNK